MIFFFDTETTGKPRKYNAPISDLDNWPRVVQIAWIVCHEDGTIASAKETIVKPDGWIIPEEAAGIHGITTEMAIEKGWPIKSFVGQLYRLIKSCDLIVGHNVEFDTSVMGAEFLRYIHENPFEGKNTLCTMKEGTEFCKLPKTTTRGSDKYKWPRLSELYFALFNQPMGAAHTALRDIENTSKCYFEMKSRGIIK